MKITTDTKQRITTSLVFLVEFYKILMGTFLCTFVPQKCDDEVCSIMDNINNTETLHFIANIFNLITFLVVIEFYRTELKRENWSITYLDIDETKPNDNLDIEIESYPKIKREMNLLNNRYLKLIYASIVFLLINFILSCVSIGYNYVGTNTVTTIVSFLLLILTKIFNAYKIGKESVENERVYSAYMKISQTYNVIDEDHRIEENNEVNVDVQSSST
jgi:hypothetical protein